MNLPWLGSIPAPANAKASRIALASILLLALTARLWVVATQTYIAYPDETFQYLEPAHRLAFGSGVVTWEYLDGIRSWLLPGVIAGVMRAVAAFDSTPQAYLLVLRLLCVGASLAVPYAGYRLGSRCAGLGGGVAAGLLCALSPQALYFAPVAMTEPLAAYATLLAIVLGADAAGRPRRLVLAGILFGLACALRYQYAPVIAAVAVWQHVRDRRAFISVAIGGAAVVVAVLGGLDWATWGAPFQSVWLNYLRNGPQGISQAIGEQSWPFYLAYFVAGWGAATPVLLICLCIGAWRSSVLAGLVVVTLALHSVVPHKELRFIFIAMAVVPMLIGIGLVSIVNLLPRRWAAPRVQVGLALALAAVIGIGTETRTRGPSDWHRDRSLLWATAAARDIPEACGLVIRSAGVYRTGGYSYWHRDVPIYFETWDLAHEIPGSSLRLRIDNIMNRKSIPQYPAAELPAHANKSNVMIGMPADILPGYAVRTCFGEDRPDDRTYCVFTRPGGCG